MIDRPVFVGILAVVVILGFFAFLAALFTQQIPEENRELLTAAAGVLFGAVTTAIGFYMGSSESSRQKDDTVAAAVRKIEPPA